MTKIIHTLLWAVLAMPGGLGQPQATTAQPDFLTRAERTELGRQAKIDGRLRVYQSASARYHSAITNGVGSEQTEAIPALLNSWIDLLTASLKDVEANIARGKKPKSLIRYEIHLRKAIVDVQGLKMKSSVDQVDAYEYWLTRAEEIRKRLVDVLFKG